MSLTLITPQNIPTTMDLLDGFVEMMGEGLFVIFQTDERGQAQSVVLAEQDLRSMLSVRERRVQLALVA